MIQSDTRFIYLRSYFYWTTLLLLLISPIFAQSSDVRMIDVYLKWGNADYLDLSGKTVLPAATGWTWGERNLQSFVVGYKAWNLIGDFVYNPSFYYEIDQTKLIGKTQTVEFNKISKYPDLAKRYQAMRPLSVNFVITADLVTKDGKSKTVKFKVTDNDLGYTNSRSAKNVQSPSSPPNGKWKSVFSTASTFPFTDRDPSDENELKLLLKNLSEVRPCYGCPYGVKVSFDIKWADEAIDEIARLYDQYEKENKKIDDELKNLKEADKLVKPVAAYNKDDEMSAPFEEEAKSAEVFKDGNSVGLRAKGKVVFESTNYSSAEPLNESKSLFAFWLSGPSNNYHLYNAKGKRISIEGHSTFLKVFTGNRTGTFSLIVAQNYSTVYTSRKHYYYETNRYFNQQEFDGFKSKDQQSPEPNRGGSSGGVYLDGARYTVEFYQGTLYTVDDKIKLISTEPVFYPGKFIGTKRGDIIVGGKW